MFHVIVYYSYYVIIMIVAIKFLLSNFSSPMKKISEQSCFKSSIWDSILVIKTNPGPQKRDFNGKVRSEPGLASSN